MLSRLVVVFALVATGCYSPTFKNDIACDPAGACPPGTTCATDGKCHAQGGHGVDIIDASTGLDIDAPIAIDAAPVGCTANADCQTPPDLCSIAGTCDGSRHVCVFPPKDCSASNDDCHLGTCEAATGTCIKAAAHGGQACGTMIPCGSFGACGEIDPTNECASHGKVARTCTSQTCQAGSCVATTYTDKQDCSVPTENHACGSRVPTGCTDCNYGLICNETAPPQPCTSCPTSVCMNDTCVVSSTSCTQACPNINTDGTSCKPCDVGFTEWLCSNGTCSQPVSCGNQ